MTTPSPIYSAPSPPLGNFNLKTFEENLKSFVPPSPEGDLSAELLKDADEIFEQHKEAISRRKFSDIRGSDTLSNGKETYYVDLVQEGGGMLGIALAGYTYILEKVGIRFASLAGTSAGAINAMGVAALPDELYSAGKTKSEYLAYLIANYDFGKFMDADKKWKRVALDMLTNRWFVRHYWLAAFGMVLLLLAFSFGIYSAFNLWFCKTSGSVHFLTGTLTFVIVSGLLYLFLILFFGKKLGINKGEEFREWIKKFMAAAGGIATTGQLKEKRKDIPLAPADGGNLSRRLVLITADLTNGRIVKFPERAPLYFKQPDSVNPAVFVRASMSIPFFFESFMPDADSGGEMAQKARFADGGMLSNFPIREFHSTTRAVPRCPTFGVKLGMEDENGRKEPGKTNLLKYIGSLIFTFRNFYDNEFLQSNIEYKKLIAFIDTRKEANGKRGAEVNWLDFNMDKDTKTFLFTEGAKTACQFLSGFDWDGYKGIRWDLYQKANGK